MRAEPNSVEEFRRALFEAGILFPSEIDGIYLRSQTFESIVAGIDRLVSETGADLGAQTLHFPLVVGRALLERTDYIRSFPDLSGSISSYTGGEKGYASLLESLERGEDWSESLELTDLGLCSAACHQLYGLLSGALAAPVRFEIFGNCFRHEPSRDPARMQVFRMHEFVYVGDTEGAQAHRDQWVGRALELHESIGLKVEAVIANDPFFGRAGGMLASNQMADALKIEIVSPICTLEDTAITSANCHREHFGEAFSIIDGEGMACHSACVGFGVERIALALLHTHGMDPQRWPAFVRERLER